MEFIRVVDSQNISVNSDRVTFHEGRTQPRSTYAAYNTREQGQAYRSCQNSLPFTTTTKTGVNIAYGINCILLVVCGAIECATLSVIN